MQSYQNVSNSQLDAVTDQGVQGCKRLCKVIKMLAIHNIMFIFCRQLFVANAYAKLSKCQQFTTVSPQMFLPVKLQTLMQSYQNVSNSQHKKETLEVEIGCKRLCKVIKMLAIHNLASSNQIALTVANAYAKLSKCQQFTTPFG